MRARGYPTLCPPPRGRRRILVGRPHLNTELLVKSRLVSLLLPFSLSIFLFSLYQGDLGVIFPVKPQILVQCSSLFIYLLIYPSYLSALSICLIYLLIYVYSIYLSIYPNICLYIYLSMQEQEGQGVISPVKPVNLLPGIPVQSPSIYLYIYLCRNRRARG